MNRFWSELKGNPALATGNLVLLALSYPAMLVLALLGRPWGFAAAAAVSYLSELYAARSAPTVSAWLSRSSVGVSVRFMFRDGAVLVLAVRTGVPSGGALVAMAVGLMALHAIRGIQGLCATFVTRRRRLPVATRNVDIAELRIPDAPPGLLVRKSVRRLQYLDVLPVAGLTVAAGTGAVAAGYAGTAAALAIGIATVLATGRHALLARPLGDKQRALDVVNDRIREHAPEVLAYFSGSVDSAYQVNMWLRTLEALDSSVLLVLRERALLRLLDVTSLPVVCIPGSVDFMNFDLPDVKAALYIANVGKNIHMLRTPGIRHVFIGHGDSDKTASFNPFSKVYDQVWVAGRGGRDRYLRAQVGVRDECIVEVGRPQLAPIRTVDEPWPADHVFTVLYAPTWEGWGDDPYQTSLTLMGERIVGILLDRDPPVRVLYKPHPLTGIRDRAAAAAHERIVAMIERAASVSAAEPEDVTRDRARARASLPGLADQLADLRGASGDRADEAQASRDSGRLAGVAPARAAELTDAWHDAYWRSEPPWAHRVVTGGLPTLYECFNQADVLVTDISSVVGDFVQSQKPYLVGNPADIDEDEFRERNPSASAAYLIGSRVDELTGVLDEVRGAPVGGDALASRRRDLKTYLLGPDEPDATTRFADAVAAVVKEGTALPGGEKREPGLAFDAEADEAASRPDDEDG
ncbi:MAG: hypothetical protein J2P24_10590 [Streptosporangiales bacterium]|nr:hypothetical protein [Streptosporangiales bacterium]MBO0889794.1 hypothetical protein [Acidothermales bacterium]